MNSKPVYDIAYAFTEDLFEVHKFFKEKLSGLLYYNDLAKESEAEHYSISQLQTMLDHDSRSVIVARGNGQLKGICINRFDDYTIWLSWIIVDNSIGILRGGVGSALLNKLNESASDRNCHKVWCDCRTDNFAGVEFLQKNGYSVLCEIKNHWYGQDFFLLERVNLVRE